MSWLARSIVNSLKLDDDNQQHPVTHGHQVDDDNSSGRGVKEDLSEITQTLTRQLWGVASFLAPPLPPGHSNDPSNSSDPGPAAPDLDPDPISGIRRDFAEIGGRFRTGISKLSNNVDVSEITKMASNFLQLVSEDDDSDSTDGNGAVGVTDEVVAFAREIAMHPDTWLDFPLLDDDDDDEDFDLSDAQQEHALAVELLAPSLGALRIELCPGYMSDSSFWKIYFVLLHPRLERHAAELLSTPKIVKARASLTHELKKERISFSENMTDSETGEHGCNKLKYVPLEICATNEIQSDDIEIVDKSVIQENVMETEGKDEDDWLKEENSIIPMENDEDVSFSDLEDDDGNIPIHYKKATYAFDSSSTKESNDWLDIDIDVV